MPLKLYWEKLSQQVSAETHMIRASFKNSSNKGDGFETIGRRFVRTYIPSTQIVTHGEVIDTADHQSKQMDLVIVQDFHPRGYEDGRPNLLFYDMVTGVGEMKMLLNTGELNNILDNAAEHSAMQRHADNNNMYSGDFYNEDNKAKLPPYYVLAYSTDIAWNTLYERTRGTNISIVVTLTRGSNKGGFVLGETHVNKNVEDSLDQLGTRVSPSVWESDNPLLALIWCLNQFYVPYGNLTNIASFYLC